jgi:hypothetical protein
MRLHLTNFLKGEIYSTNTHKENVRSGRRVASRKRSQKADVKVRDHMTAYSKSMNVDWPATSAFQCKLRSSQN